jgi:hypothetical protein
MSEDAHRRTAALMLGKPPDEVTPDERRLGKLLNAAFATGTAELAFTRVFRETAPTRGFSTPLAEDLPDKELHRLFLRFCRNVLGMTHPELESELMWGELDGGPVTLLCPAEFADVKYRLALEGGVTRVFEGEAE